VGVAVAGVGVTGPHQKKATKNEASCFPAHR